MAKESLMGLPRQVLFFLLVMILIICGDPDWFAVVHPPSL